MAGDLVAGCLHARLDRRKPPNNLHLWFTYDRHAFGFVVSTHSLLDCRSCLVYSYYKGRIYRNLESSAIGLFEISEAMIYILTDEWGIGILLPDVAQSPLRKPMIVVQRVMLRCTSGDLDQSRRRKSNPMCREDGDFLRQLCQ